MHFWVKRHSFLSVFIIYFQYSIIQIVIITSPTLSKMFKMTTFLFVAEFNSGSSMHTSSIYLSLVPVKFVDCPWDFSLDLSNSKTRKKECFFYSKLHRDHFYYFKFFELLKSSQTRLSNSFFNYFLKNMNVKLLKVELLGLNALYKFRLFYNGTSYWMPIEFVAKLGHGKSVQKEPSRKCAGLTLNNNWIVLVSLYISRYFGPKPVIFC